MPETNPGDTISSLALGALLDDKENPHAQAIAGRFHRTMLWRLRTGRRSPDLETAAEVEKLSGGLVTAVGWTQKTAKEPAA